MSNHLGLLEIDCDAPPYPIVRACRKLGMSDPEDVRWCGKARHGRRHHGWIHFLLGFAGNRCSDTEAATCTCGAPLPVLECYAFTFQSGEQIDYEIGQCPRCRTIYWEKL